MKSPWLCLFPWVPQCPGHGVGWGRGQCGSQQPAPHAQGVLLPVLGLLQWWEARWGQQALPGDSRAHCSHIPTEVKSASPLLSQVLEVPESHPGCIASRCSHHTASCKAETGSSGPSSGGCTRGAALPHRQG